MLKIDMPLDVYARKHLEKAQDNRAEQAKKKRREKRDAKREEQKSAEKEERKLGSLNPSVLHVVKRATHDQVLKPV
jgi:sRNA-binding protein